MAIVCTDKQTIWCRFLRPVTGLLALFAFFPMNGIAAPAPSAAQCNAALAASTYPSGLETQVLSFGGILTGTAGTVTIDTLGAVTTTPKNGGPTLYAGVTAQVGIVTFSTGALDCSALSPTVTFTPGTISNGTDTLTVTNFTYSTDPSKKNQSKFNTGTFYIGADLGIATGLESGGTYTGGAYTMTITF